MPRQPQPVDDLDRYIANREAREPGFATLVEDAEEKLRQERYAGEQAGDRDDATESSTSEEDGPSRLNASSGHRAVAQLPSPPAENRCDAAVRFRTQG